jgi:hypothetical protein
MISYSGLFGEGSIAGNATAERQSPLNQKISLVGNRDTIIHQNKLFA